MTNRVTFRTHGHCYDFWYYVEKTETCWLWTGTRKPKGYGVFHPAHGQTVAAHRHSFYLATGELPQYVCHLCDVPACVNPAHLFAGTPTTNRLDSSVKGRHLHRWTEAEIREIRALCQAKVSYAEVGRRFGTDASAVRHIALRHVWAWLS